MNKFDIAVIGAGLAGLTAADRLRGAGCRVVVIDKARGPGGRLATRRGEGTVRMDHGCQYLAEMGDGDSILLEKMLSNHCVAVWSPIRVGPDTRDDDQYPEGECWHVGVPTMSAIPRSMAEGLDVKLNSRVTRLMRMQDEWSLFDDQDVPIASATWVLSAIPSPQALDLLRPHEFSGLQVMSQVIYDPNWTLMLVEPVTSAGAPAVIRPASGPISWIVNQKSKPGRPDVNAWVAQANTRWSIDNLELSQEEVIQKLRPEIQTLVGRQIEGEASAHRWRYAFVKQPAGQPAFVDAGRRLAACGDWCLGRTVTHAMSSGWEAAGRILSSMN